MKIERLWARYERTPTEQLRNRIIEHYVDMVDGIASSVASKLPKNVDRDDLVSSGYLGLMDAVEKFDLSRGLKFETYAVNRIRGAMLDELRSSDWVPRSVRTRSKIIETASQELQDRLGRPPEDFEIAAELGMSVSKVRKDRDKAMSGRMVPLDQMVGGDGDDSMMLMDILSDDKQSDVDQSDDELFKSTADVVDGKDGREGIVIALYYYEGLTLADIGRVLGVTESRVCQIHTKAIGDLDITV